MWADVYTSESPHNLLFGVSLHPGSPEQRKSIFSIVLPFNNNTINLSVTTGFILPNDHSQQQQQQSRPRIYSDQQNPNLLFFSASSGLELEMREVGEESMITRDNNHCIHLLLAVPTVDQRLRRMVFYLLIHRGGLFQMRLGKYHNEYDDSNLADETGKSLENYLAQSLCPGSVQIGYNHFVSPKLQSQTRSLLSFFKIV